MMKPILLAKLFIISLFIPGEFHVSLGGLRLDAYRIVLGISTIAGLSYVSRRFRHLQVPDKCILAASGWGVLSLLINHGLTEGIEKSGIFFFEIFGAYFLGRQAIVNDNRLIATYKLLGFMVLIFVIPTMIEMLTGKKVVHDIASAITGKNILAPSLYTEDYMRHGMTRATSAFTHPILNGTICATVLPFAFYLVLRYKKPLFVVMAIGSFLSAFSALSSAPLLVIAVQVAFAGYVKLKQIIKSKMRYVIMAVCFCALVVQLFSNRGIVKIIIQTATFNPHTGTHRLLIIEHLRDDIMRSPFFGSGLGAPWTAPTWMGQSIDNFWWATAFTYGIPFSVIVAITGFYCISKIKVSEVPEKEDYLAYAAKASVLSLMILGLTVHLFGKVNPLFYFTLGSVVFLFNPSKDQDKQSEPQQKSYKSRRRRYARQ